MRHQQRAASSVSAFHSTGCGSNLIAGAGGIRGGEDGDRGSSSTRVSGKAL